MRSTAKACRNFEAGRNDEFLKVLRGIDLACCARRPYFDTTVNGVNSRTGPSHSIVATCVNTWSVAWPQKCSSRGRELTFMDARIANRAVVTIEVVSRAVIIIAIGMISTLIGASIYESFRTLH
jgi:hypothetical protein